MIITKQQIETVSEFIKSNNDTYGRLNLLNQGKQISDLIGYEFECNYISISEKDTYIYIRNESLYILLFQNVFVWNIHFNKEATIQTVHALSPLIEKLIKYKEAIEYVIQSSFHEIGKYNVNKKLLNDAKWCFDRVETFFDIFDTNGTVNEVDTEEKLKEIRKIPFADWYKTKLYKCMDGKNESIKVYRRVFDCFEKVAKSLGEPVPA